jgi:hypothetical protein
MDHEKQEKAYEEAMTHFGLGWSEQAVWHYLKFHWERPWKDRYALLSGFKQAKRDYGMDERE